MNMTCKVCEFKGVVMLSDYGFCLRCNEIRKTSELIEEDLCELPVERLWEAARNRRVAP